MAARLFSSLFLGSLLFSPALAADEPNGAWPKGVAPTGSDGKPLNLDFETGDLRDWTADGAAFDKQPVEGDTVGRRRADMKSGHRGRFWAGTYEVAGDPPHGTLTSKPFKVTQPWASFLVGGGATEQTRVDLADAKTGELIFRVSGEDREDMRPVVVDLSPKWARRSSSGSSMTPRTAGGTSTSTSSASTPNGRSSPSPSGRSNATA
jgi:hypothetical protein